MDKQPSRPETKVRKPLIVYNKGEYQLSIVTLYQQVDHNDWLVYGCQEYTFVSGDSSELVTRRARDEVSDNLSDNSNMSDSTYYLVDSLDLSEDLVDHSHENAVHDTFDR
jgi:hypothetical protein